jgi:periplasmic protein TonB
MWDQSRYFRVRNFVIAGASGSNLRQGADICVTWDPRTGCTKFCHSEDGHTGSMGSAQINPKSPGQEPELHFLFANESFEEPLWKSLPRQIDEFFFPKKLPPLKLESKPEPVKNIWGFYDNKKNGALGSTGVHILLVAAIIGGTMLGHHVVTAAAKKEVTVTLIDPDSLPALKPSKTLAGGGGGGGDRDVLKATKGHLPKFSMQQITPPMVVVRNEHPKLAVEPTVVIPPQVQIATNKMPNLGDPTSNGVLPSNGTGYGGGIGSGSGGGVGSGSGPGFGPGEGGGYGGGVFHVGGGVSPPRVIYQVDPEFSEEARKAKYQGTCTLMLVVDTSGKPRNIRVASSLGMGLDEKAIEAVKQWRFEPSQKDGHAVPVEIAVEVEFHLY